MKRLLTLVLLAFSLVALGSYITWAELIKGGSKIVTPGGGPAPEPWSPANPFGTERYWIDFSDNDTLSVEGGGVTSIVSKVGTWSYTQPTEANRPALGTVNGVQCGLGGSPRYMSKEQDALIAAPNEKFLFVAVIKHESTPIISGIWGDAATGLTMANFESGNDANWGRYSWITNDGRFTSVRFDSSNVVPSTDVEIVTLTYDGVNNDTTGWSGQRNDTGMDVVSGTNHPDFGGFGRLFDNTLGYYFNGYICEIWVIVDYTAEDKTESIAYASDKYL